MKHVKVWVGGAVQGVGFRWWVSRQATRLGLAGHVENLWDGRVEIDVQGPDPAVDEMIRLVTDERSDAGRPGRLRFHLSVDEEPNLALGGFEVR